MPGMGRLPEAHAKFLPALPTGRWTELRGYALPSLRDRYIYLLIWTPRRLAESVTSKNIHIPAPHLAFSRAGTEGGIHSQIGIGCLDQQVGWTFSLLPGIIFYFRSACQPGSCEGAIHSFRPRTSVGLA